MRWNIGIVSLLLLLGSCTESNTSSPLKPLLLQQFKHTHTDQNWFVPTKIALEGVTAEQANWKDSTDNHSIAELVSHIIYWNEVNLKAFKGEEVGDLAEDNETTFDEFTDQEWKALINKLDQIQSDWEKEVAQGTDKQLTEWSTEIANMLGHNAYHTGQIIYIRKRKGWWRTK